MDAFRHAALEPHAVEAHLDRVPLQVLRSRLRGLSEEHVVVFPELALLAGAAGCLRCAPRLRMGPIEREVPVDMPHLAGIALEELCQRWLQLPAERAVEVGELRRASRARRRALGPAPRRPARRAGQSEVTGAGPRPWPATGASPRTAPVPRRASAAVGRYEPAHGRGPPRRGGGPCSSDRTPRPPAP